MVTCRKVNNTSMFACTDVKYWKNIEGIDHELSSDRGPIGWEEERMSNFQYLFFVSLQFWTI